MLQKAREKVCRKNGGHFPDDPNRDTVCLACGRHLSYWHDDYATGY